MANATAELAKYRHGLQVMSGGFTLSGGEPLMQHRFAIKLIDSDGKNLLPPVNLEVQVKLRDDTFFASQNIVMNLQGVNFPRPGQFSIDITYDDRIVSRVPVQVLEMKQPV